MANQIVVSAGAKVRNLSGVLTAASGVVSFLPIDVSLGIPQLDVNGKILVSQLPNSVMEYKGTWDASTNTPTLANGTGNQGDVYLCNVAGTVNFGAGAIAFVVGDSVIYSGSIWQRASGATGTVTSVAVTESGDSLNITGSPITTSGTINIGFNGTNLQYVNGAGNLTTFPILTGYVTAVSGTAPVVSSGGTTPAISMAAATSSVDGYLLATDFAIFSAKQSALTFSSPLVNTSGTISIPAATTSVNGYLASADFTTFNNKQNAITLTTTGSSGVSTLVGATLNIPDYGSALTGYVTLATTQTISGAKTFSAYTTFTSTVDITSGLTFSNSGFTLLLQPPTLSVNRTVTLPNGTGTLALTSDISYPVSSVFGRTGAVVAVSADYNTSQVTESGNLYFTDSRARLALSFVAGSGAYNSTTGVITIPTNNNQITNGAGYTTNVGTVTSVAATGGTGISISGSPITTSGTITITNTAPDQTVALTASTGISVTGTYPNFTITNTSPSSGGTVTSVAALTIGTSGTDLSSSVANSTTTPVITLNVPTASATNRGALSSADWTTFNNKQATITLTTTGTSGAATFSSNTLNIPNYGSALSGYLPLTGGTLTGALIATSNVTIRPTSGYNAYFQTSGTALRINYLNDALSANISAAYRATDFVWQKGDGTDVLKLDSTGNLGLGVTPSAWASGLSVFQGSSSLSVGNSGNGGMNVLANAYYGSNWTYVSSAQASWYQQIDGKHAWHIAPSGTAGNAITFTQAMTLTAAGELLVGTSTLGTSTAISDLLTLGKSGSSSIAVNFTDGTATRWGFIYANSAKMVYGSFADVVFESGASATERMRIWGSTGNVYIGTTPASDSGYKLDVNGTGRFSTTNNVLGTFQTTGGYSAIQFTGNGGTDWGVITTYAGLIYFGKRNSGGTGADPNLTINTSTGAATFSSSVTAGGSIYVGGTQSGAMSAIYGASNYIYYNQSAASAIQVANTNTVTNGSIIITNTGGTGSYSIIGNAGIASGYGLYIQSQDRTAAAYYPLLLQPNGANVLIGTTDDGGKVVSYTTNAAQQFKAAGTAPAITFSNTVLSPTIGGVLGACTAASQFLSGTASGDMVLANQFSGFRLYVASYSGGVYLTSGATSWTANSDIRLKNINSHIENAVEKLSTLQTINFSYKDDKFKKQNLGLIAQEVEKIFPELIDKNGDGMLGVRYTELVPVLIKAVQELKLEIETLKNK